MTAATNVNEWNLLRRIYKKEYSTNIINHLDASGFIYKTLKSKGIAKAVA